MHFNAGPKSYVDTFAVMVRAFTSWVEFPKEPASYYPRMIWNASIVSGALWCLCEPRASCDVAIMREDDFHHRQMSSKSILSLAQAPVKEVKRALCRERLTISA
jgi:hypothetical protein